MDVLKNAMQTDTDKSFIKIVKEVLGDRIVDDKEVVFEKKRIVFKAASANRTTVPVFVKIKHR